MEASKKFSFRTIIKNQRDDTFSSSLIVLYKNTSFFLLPLLLIYVLTIAAGKIEADVYMIVSPILAISAGVYSLLFYKKDWAKNSFGTVHLFLLSTITITSALSFTSSPGHQELLKLMLTIFIVGIVLIQTTITVVYFLFTTILVGYFAFTTVLVGIEHCFYVFFMGVLIVAFSFWRRGLIIKLGIAKTSYKNIFNDSAEFIFLLDDALTILEINESALHYLKGKSKENIIGSKFNDVFCANNSEEEIKFWQALELVKQGGKANFEAECELFNDGHLVPKEFKISRSTYFEHEVTVVAVRTLENQKEHEQQLIESKENISKVLDNINSFVFNITHDHNGGRRVNYVSNKVKEVYGIEADEYITLIKSNRLNEIFYHEDREEAIQLFDEVINTIKENRIKFRIVRNGEIRWIEEKIFPATTKLGAILLFGIVTDITEQTLALLATQKSEERYRQIFERNMAGVYKTHVDGTILEANPMFAKILGQTSAEDLIGKNIKEFYVEKLDRTGYIERLRKEKSLNNYISKLKRKDGKELTLNNNVSIYKDEDGLYNIIEGTLIDITEVEETAKALKLSEEKYRILFEDATTSILLLSLGQAESKVLDINAAAKVLLGYSEHAALGLSLSDIAENGNALQEKINQLSIHKKLELEWQFKNKTGKLFFTEASFVPLVLGQKTIVQGIIKDISERKQNEKQLLESQESFKNIVDNSPASILIFTEGELTYMNPSGQKLYDEVLNTNSKSIFSVFPEKFRFLLSDLIKENNTDSTSYNEIDLGPESGLKKYSLNVVNTVYTGKPSSLFLLRDITLQNEYSTQKLRAEIAEETNKVLQEEIENHKKTQAELVEKTFWLNALFESSHNLFILSLDKDYKITSYNENFKRMIKTTLGKEVAAGDVFLDLFGTTGLAKEKIEKRFAQVLMGKTFEMISHYPSKRGEVWVESFLNPLKLDEHEIGEISFISHEITDKVEAQRKTKVSEANNRAILLAMPDALYKVLKAGIITDYRINQPKLEAGALFSKNVIGKHVAETFADQVMASKFMNNIHKAIAKNDLITETIELRYPDKDLPVYYENRFSKMNEDEVIVLSRNITETIEYEAMLVESVREKEILLKEVHHRVKNNLQVINSILNLQSSYVEDAKTLEIINESQNRIRSMSYIHESLYQTKDFSSINFADYISNLVQNLVHSYQLYQNKIELDLQIEPVKLALDQAIPCGLILNELISNSLKYAYPDDGVGKIKIQVTEKKNMMQFVVEDFGIGLPKDFDVENSDSLGLSLVYTLVEQLDGQLILKTDGGTKFLITFEKQDF